MNFNLYDLFFDLGFNNLNELALKLLIFIAAWLLLLYVIYFILNKVVKSDIHREYQLRVNFLWALGIFQFLVCIYFFFLLKEAGTASFIWDKIEFYAALAPQIIIFFGTIIWYYIKSNQYKKLTSKRI